MKRAPSGLGVFIWEISYCEGGDVEKIIAKAKQAGLSWLILHEIIVVPEGIIAKLKAAGFYVACSFYSVPGQPQVQAFIHKAVTAVALGVDAILVDAEEFWEKLPDGGQGWRGPEATAFVTALRTAVGDDVWIGDAGAWQLPKSHPTYPDKEFSALMDGALPERYFTEFEATVSYEKAMENSEAEWAQYPDVQGYKVVIPIGPAYGTNTHPSGGHQPLRPEDFGNFLQRYPTSALWSWVHCPAWAWEMMSKAVQPAQ